MENALKYVETRALFILLKGKILVIRLLDQTKK